jgi:hypothetical protein
VFLFFRAVAFKLYAFRYFASREILIEILFITHEFLWLHDVLDDLHPHCPDPAVGCFVFELHAVPFGEFPVALAMVAALRLSCAALVIQRQIRMTPALTTSKAVAGEGVKLRALGRSVKPLSIACWTAWCWGANWFEVRLAHSCAPTCIELPHTLLIRGVVFMGGILKGGY